MEGGKGRAGGERRGGKEIILRLKICYYLKPIKNKEMKSSKS